MRNVGDFLLMHTLAPLSGCSFREQVTVSFFGLEGERLKPFTFFIASLCGDNSLSHAFTARVSFTKWLPFLHCSSEQLDKKKDKFWTICFFFFYLLFCFGFFWTILKKVFSISSQKSQL